MNILCPICSDLVNQADNFYVTKCGHVFHYHCLSQWITRSNSCPQCRNKVTPKCMFRVYPTLSSEDTKTDAVTLQSRLDDVNLQLRQQNIKAKEAEEHLDKLTSELRQQQELIKMYEKKSIDRNFAITVLKEELNYVKIENREMQQLRKENESLNKNIQLLNGLQTVLNATTEEVKEMVQSCKNVETVAIFTTALKRALCEAEAKKKEMRDQLHSTKVELTEQKKKYTETLQELGETKDKYTQLEKKYKAVRRDRERENVDVIDITNNDVSVTKDSVLSERNVSLNNILRQNNTSLIALVNTIENSDSPYLNLKQSSVALSALTMAKKPNLNNIKPSERSMLSKINRPSTSKAHPAPPVSIFHKKQPVQVDLTSPTSTTHFDTSYDGLGGHSTIDRLPTRSAVPVKSNIPKVTAKHKLKRPTPSGSQGILEMLKKSRNC